MTPFVACEKSELRSQSKNTDAGTNSFFLASKEGNNYG